MTRQTRFEPTAKNSKTLMITCIWESTTAPPELNDDLLREALRQLVIDLVDYATDKISVHLALTK